MGTNKALRIVGIVFSIVGAAQLIPGAVLLILRLLGRGGLGTLIPGAVLAPMGAVFLGLGLLFFGMVRRRRRQVEDLLANGECVRAKIAGVTRNYAVQVNGRSPYRVLCRYTDGAGTVHEYHSDDLDFDPTGLFLSDEAKVYRDRYNEKRYYVDLSRALPPVEIH